MPFTRVGGISHVIGGGDCPRRHNSRIKGGDCPRLAKQSQLYSPVFCGMPGDRGIMVRGEVCNANVVNSSQQVGRED